MARNNAAWLAELCSQGPDQQAALVELREELLGRIRRAFSNRVGVGDEFCEDIVQNSLVRILDRIEQFEHRSHFLTWATSIAIRIATSELRRRRWGDVSLEEVVSDARLMPGDVVDSARGPETLSEREAILRILHDSIENKLTVKQRTALLAELKGMPQDKIARQIGTSRNALYKMTHDARRKLKQELEAAGYRAADIHAAFAT